MNSLAPAAAPDKDGLQALLAAAYREDDKAQFRLGMMYETGQGVARDVVQALAWYRRAAGWNNAQAQTMLGLTYALGIGAAPADYAQALHWLRLAAAQGCADGQFGLGLMYEQGFGVARNHAHAIDWYSKAARQGHVDAQFRAGDLYCKGYEGYAADGKPRPLGHAYRMSACWLRRAAAQGHEQAQYLLGWMYAEGHGVKKSPAQSALWYRKAAARGNARALEELFRLRAAAVRHGGALRMRRRGAKFHIPLISRIAKMLASTPITQQSGAAQLLERGIDLATGLLRGASEDGCTPILLLLGADGAPSELLRALAPHLARPGALPGVDFWGQITLTPTNGVFREFAKRLLADKDLGPYLNESGFRARGSLAPLLGRYPDLAARLLTIALANTTRERRASAGETSTRPARLLLAIDHAEDIFTRLKPEIAFALTELLVTLVRAEAAYVIVALPGRLQPGFVQLQALREHPALVLELWPGDVYRHGRGSPED